MERDRFDFGEWNNLRSGGGSIKRILLEGINEDVGVDSSNGEVNIHT